jgi:hypothetical protein
MKIIFIHEHSRYARIYRSSTVFEASEFGLVKTGWVWSMLKERGLQTHLQRGPTRDITTIHRCLKLLATSYEWTEFANLKFGKFTIEELVGKFHLCDEVLIAEGITQHQIKRWTSCLRNWSLDFLRKQGMPRYDRFRVLFQSRLQYPRKHGRKLISDYVDASDDTLPPVGASPGADVQKMRQAMVKRFDHDIHDLMRACESELEEFAKLSSYVERAIRSVDEKIVQKAIAASKGQSMAWRGVAKLDPLTIEAAYLALLVRSYSERVTDEKYRTLNGASAVASNMTARLGIKNCKRLTAITLHSQFGSPLTVLACAFAIQLRTAWNISSIFSLTTANVVWLENEVEIQGIKTKTDDLTPIERIEKDSLAYRALSFLHARLGELKKLNWVSADEQHLWLSPSSARKGRLLAYSAWSKALIEFQGKHKLPRFSLEQVRNQVLAREVVSSGGSLETTRRRAGHRSISVTGHYLDQLLLHRLNSSINLEFQRRLEQSIEMRLKSPSSISDREHKQDLLYPVGDGSSCTNPLKPPSSDYLGSTMCTGKHCHIGDGCVNRRVVIDHDRLEEVIRMSFFYERNWRSLLAKNEQSFQRHHLPAFLFNVSLLGILKRGPYKHVVRTLEIQILEGAANDAKN